jgi:DNA-damage-inducible protein J
MSGKNISFRIDEDLKEEGEKLFKELGMNMTTALTIFIKQSVRERKIPFQINLGVPSIETLEAIVEAEKMLKDPNTKKYKNVKELLEELDS